MDVKKITDMAKETVMSNLKIIVPVAAVIIIAGLVVGIFWDNKISETELQATRKQTDVKKIYLRVMPEIGEIVKRPMIENRQIDKKARKMMNRPRKNKTMEKDKVKENMSKGMTSVNPTEELKKLQRKK